MVVNDGKDTEGRLQSARALRALAYVMLAGTAGIILFSTHYGFSNSTLVSVATGLAIGGAAALSGGLIGFVFAIPRTLQQDRRVGNGGSASQEDLSTWYQANTNLEQISDWLTKIIIGVSLVEIKEIPGLLRAAAEYASPGLGSSAVGERFAAVVIVYFSIAGFVFSYLWTRLYMVGALRTADTEGLGQRFAKVERKLEELRTKEELDARALSLAQRQLEPNEDEPPIAQSALDASIAAASNAARSTIFREAEKLRRETWRDSAEKTKMERTIPIFSALISADPNYHRDHAQLGYGLKDRRIPDLEGAKQELARAIELRGAWQTNGYVMYELNRAACEILLERQAAQQGSSPEKVKTAVLEDLRAAAQGGLGEIIEKDPLFQDWLRRNGISDLG